MPNIIIETSHQHLINQPEKLLASINEKLWQSGHFKQTNDIKSRIYTPNHTLIGLDAQSEEAFIVVHFYLMPGRDDDTIKNLADSIAQTIKQHLALDEKTGIEGRSQTNNLQICVNPTVLSHQYVKLIV